MTLRILLHFDIPSVMLQNGDEMPPEYRKRSTEYYYFSSGRYEPVQINANELSAPIRYQGNSEFVLYIRQPAKDPQLADTYLPSLRCRLPEGGSGSYILVGLEKIRGPKSMLKALPIGSGNFPEGSVLAYNLGGRTLQVAFGSKRLTTIEPDHFALLQAPNGQSLRFQVMAAIGENNNYKLVYRRTWPIRKKGNLLCLFFPTNAEMTRWNSQLVDVD
ncbi:hypothetical protein H5P28_06165 [Ruficoccus amylovorans]|uniref:Uncharacterized protein n=1 Tax=Ruficoccus amylovorans TaxID=1804625 RepID=A0A842HEV2_9BACT|nr:hypothetical protein [Ruficoccus amylovorans]MBC2593841.1 hypothetical protein [Ruficoccus amylovorans]